MIYTLTAVFLFLFALVTWDSKTCAIYSKGQSYTQSLNEKQRRLLLMSSVWLILIEGLRWEIGTDWSHYYNFFINGDNEHMDYGYELFNKIIHIISDSYTTFLLAFAFATYIVIYRLVKRYSINPLMSLCIYYCTMLCLLGCNRQIAAMLVVILSVKYIIERKLYSFILCIAVAVLFHKTALVFLPAYFLANVKYDKKLAISISVGCFIIGITHLVNKIPFIEYIALLDKMSNSSSGYDIYVDAEVTGVSIVGSLKRLVFILFAIYAKEKVKDRNYSIFVLFYTIGSCLYLAFNGSLLQLFASRGTLYYNIFECLVIPTAIYYFPLTKPQKKALWFMFFIFYIYIMWRDVNYYALADGVDIYNPYKCVLFQ